MLLCRRLHSQIRLPKNRTPLSNIRSNFTNGHTTTPFRTQPTHLNNVPRTTNTPSPDNARDIGAQVDGPSRTTQPGSQTCNIDTTLANLHTNTQLGAECFPNFTNFTRLKKAVASGDSDLIHKLVHTILRSHLQPGMESSRVHELKLLLSTDVVSVLSLPTLDFLLSSMGSSSFHPSVKSISQLISCINGRKDEIVSSIISHLHQHILYHVRRIRRFNFHSVSYIPPSIVRSAFRFIRICLIQHQELVVDIFQVLIETGHIPSEAMVHSSSSHTFEQIIGISLIKASLYWNWVPFAEQGLTQLLQTPLPPDSFALRHATDSLYTLLMAPSSANDLERCFNIICLLHPYAPVPDGLVRQFYNCAVELNATTAAESMYEFSRAQSTVETHSYPSPQGKALGWLMSYITKQSKKLFLARTLASDVVQDHIPLPISSRAQFIVLAARKGFANSARALWERYATGKDSAIVLGNSALMLRITSLFTNLIRRLEAKIAEESDDAEGTRELEAKTLDLRQFVDQVISKFREYHLPLDTADHRVLTSYARACFIIGKNTEGFNIFKILLDRRELPDLHDVNVALTAIAKQDVKAAARMIKKMTENGMDPDVVSLGTVLHYASAHGNSGITDEMMAKIMVLDFQSDMKVFGALIRAVVEPHRGDTKEDKVRKLKTAWELVQGYALPGSESSTQLGSYLVSLAIEAEEARLAFSFWRTFLKESREWDDAEHSYQRYSIGRLTREQNRNVVDRGPPRKEMTELWETADLSARVTDEIKRQKEKGRSRALDPEIGRALVAV